jgi:hypothetical protein
MAWVDPGVAQVMKVDVATTSNGGHPPEFWASRCAERIVQVSESAHPAIREQALAYKNQVEQIILFHMKHAIQSDRTTVGHAVTEAGQPQLAELLRRL